MIRTTQESEGEMERLFQEYDADRSGKIDARELRAVLGRYHHIAAEATEKSKDEGKG